MTLTLPELILQDHRKVQALCKELINECGRAASNEEVCLNLFRILKALTVAHLKAEEFTLYALFDESSIPERNKLQDMVYENYEEHDLADFLMKEMAVAEEVTPQWRAQMKVLSNLLTRMMENEERYFLPQVVNLIEPEELLDLSLVYMRERDSIFAKKSGMREQPKFPEMRHF